MAITGIPVGGTGSLTATGNGSPNGGLQAGDVPVWSADDTLVTITPAADGMSATAAVSASDTANTFNLTVTGVNSAGTKIATTVAVPILPAVAVPATGFNINQTA